MGVPCGCDLLRRAEKIDHAGNRAQRIEIAREFQRRWRCPAVTGRFPKTPDALDPACRRTAEGVERLVGAGGLCTCPLAYARTPAVNVAVTYRNRREKNWLAQTAPAVLPARLVAAIELIDRAATERLADEIERNRPKEDP